MICKSKVLVVALLLLFGCQLQAQSSKVSDDGFKTIFNGENFDGWYLKIRANNDSLAQKVFAIEDGMVHVFNDEFPDNYKLNTKENDTHGLFYTKKSYSKYILRFQYKWGAKKANNFDQWQYDAGVYYHVTNDNVWPIGIEYQIRFDDRNGKNHTGDYIRPRGASYDWYATADGATYLNPKDGGVLYTGRDWYHHASEITNFNGLNDKWNTCEIIVMGDAYSIHKLNGEIINMAFNLKPSEGIFGFQAETAEIFYRNIEIKEFDKIIPMEEFLSE